MKDSKTVVKYCAGKVLFSIGDPGGDLIVVKKGLIGIFKVDKKGNETEIAQLGPGELMGAMTVFSCSARTATARAIEDSEVYQVPSPQVEKMMMTCPPWLKIITKDLIARVDIANEKYISKTKELEAMPSLVVSQNKIACQLARGILQFGKHYVKERGGKTVIPVHKAIESTLKVLCYHNKATRKIIDHVIKIGFLSRYDEKTYLTVDSVEDFAKYSDFVNDIQSSQKAAKILGVTAKERRQLKKLLNIVSHLEMDREHCVSLYFAQLEKIMHSVTGSKFEPVTMEIAHQSGLIRIDTDEEGKYIEFVPIDLFFTLKSIELYKTLDRDSS